MTKPKRRKPPPKVYKRFPDCRSYHICLDQAARSDTLFDCRKCTDYIPLSEDELKPADGELLGYSKLVWAVLYPAEWKHHHSGEGGGGGTGYAGDEPGTGTGTGTGSDDEFYFLFPFAGHRP